MLLAFSKFQGNGNDFVILDNRKKDIVLTPESIRYLCDRHYGIGADGLILLENWSAGDYEMLYFNADGHLASMCGNGARCLAAYARMLGIAAEKMDFKAYDGRHRAVINKVIRDRKKYDVSVTMGDVTDFEKEGKFYFLDTGSPHYVEFVDKVAEIDVAGEGRKTRYSERFAPEGTNVNFVEVSGDRIFVRTYERGVEDETLSCGTGVTASAIASYLHTGRKGFQIHTTGGEFRVDFKVQDETFTSVWLSGPAEMTFEGNIQL
jgi:diaminopimelate epimerase